MNKFKLITIILLMPFLLYSQQDNIIIMVDVSASVPRYIKNPSLTANAIRDIIAGSSIGERDFRLETSSGSTMSGVLYGTGKKIIIVPFGEQATDELSKRATPRPISSLADIQKVLDNEYPKYYKDNKTYRTLALARCAQIAKNNGMNSYWLFIATDETGDDFSGQPANYSVEQQTLIDSYKSPSNKVDDTKQGIIKYGYSNTFKVDIQRINLGSYIAPPMSPPVIPTDTAKNSNCKITLVSFADGTPKKPKVAASSPVGISWTCNCENIKEFRVGVSGIGGTKVEQALRNKLYSVKNASIPLDAGKYRISISANGASSASTVLSVETGGGFGWLILLLLLVAAYFGYDYWNKKRDKMAKTDTSSKGNSKSNNGTSIAPEGDYF